MKTIRMTSLLFSTIFMAINAFGFYPPPDADEGIKPFGTRLIIKFKPDKALGLNRSTDGLILTGVTEIDRLNKEYKVQSAVSFLNGQNTLVFKNTYILELTGADFSDIERIADEYEALASVEYAEPDYWVNLYDYPDDSLFGLQWNLHNTGQLHYAVERLAGYNNDTLAMVSGAVDCDIDALEVIENPPDNTVTSVVAILDTGVDMDHPDLADNIWVNPREIPDNGIDDDNNGYIDDMHGWDFSASTTEVDAGDNDPTDEHGHGTHCSGIVAAVTGNNRGVAGIGTDCRIMALKFDPLPLTSKIARAVIYAADNGADVINMSFGLGFPSDAVGEALSYAYDRGVILCAATGNDGTDIINFPSGYPFTIAVGATDDVDHVATFSTFGEHIDIVAPGRSILSLRAANTDIYASSNEPNVHIIDNLYYLASGTSMACPHVSGVAGMLRAVSPGLKPDKAARILAASADDLTDPYGIGWNLTGWDMYSGHGRVNLEAALSQAPKIRAVITSPGRHEILSGTVYITGMADGIDFESFAVDYGIGERPDEWITLKKGFNPVTDNVMAEWNTTGLSGIYTIRLRVGSHNEVNLPVYLANSTSMVINQPAADDTINTLAAITGSAYSADFSHLVLEYKTADVIEDAWEEIAVRTTPVYDDIMAYWLLSGLEEGDYYLRLSLYSTTGLLGYNSTTIHVHSLYDTEHAWKSYLDRQLTIMPNYADLDGDGSNEIIVGRDNGITVFNLDGTIKTENIPDFPVNNFVTPIAIGNLDGDGIDDMVAIGYDPPFVYGYLSSGEDFINYLGMFPPVSAFSTNTEHRFPKVFLKDIDNDGLDEVHVVITDNTRPTVLVLNSDGTIRHKLEHIAEYQPADLDGDGIDELYTFPAYYGFLKVLDQSDGHPIDSFLIQRNGSSFRCEGMSAFDIDNDGKLELMAFGYYSDQGYFIYAFDEGLQLKPGWPHDMAMDNFVTPTVPVFGDIDSDGSIEYFTGYYDLDYSYLFAWNIDGSSYLSGSPDGFFTRTPQVSVMNMLVVTDINGDGDPDIVACANNDAFFTFKVQRIYAWDKNADLIDGFPIVTSHDAYSYYRYVPTIGDIDGDGFVDLTMNTIDKGVVYISFPNVPFDPCAAPAPMWRYGRSLANVMPSYLPCEQSGVDDDNPPIPDDFMLAQNYPNPFNPSTTIEYALPARSDVILSIYNILGRKVKTLVEKNESAGKHRVIWDGTDNNGNPAASGIYFYRIEAGSTGIVRKMTLLK